MISKNLSVENGVQIGQIWHQGAMPTLKNGNTRECSSSIIEKSDGNGQSMVGQFNRPLSRVPSISENDGIHFDWSSFNHINQDVLIMKTNLLKLKRILQEAEVGNSIELEVKPESLYACLVAAEAQQLTLAATAAGHSQASASRNRQAQSQKLHEPCAQSTVTALEENQDLKRQLIFLNQQIEDKDRRIKNLESLLHGKTSDTPPSIHSAPITPSMATANTATQTERSRPVSCGGHISHAMISCDQGGFISSNSSNSSIPGIPEAFYTTSPLPSRSSRISKRQVDRNSKEPKLLISNRKISCDRGRSPSGGRHTAKRAESPRVSEKTTSAVSQIDAGFTSRSDASMASTIGLSGLRKVSAPNSSLTSRNKYLPSLVTML